METERGIVEVLGAGRTPVGLGFVVGRRTVVTCAHVVNTALGRPLRQCAQPDPGELAVQFPFAPGTPQRLASVVRWAPAEKGDFDATDLAGLILEEEAPAEVEPVTLSRASDLAGEPRVGMWGPVAGRIEGGHVSGVLLGLLPGGRRQLNQEVVGTFRAAPGFSGGPVWLLRGPQRVAGMLVAIAGRNEARDVYVLDVDRLTTLWPEQLQVEGDRPSLEVTWSPAGFGLPPGEFVFVLPGNAVVECAIVLANRGPELETVTRVEVKARVRHEVPRLDGPAVRFGLGWPLASEGHAGGFSWIQVADDLWVVEERFPLRAGEDIWLPAIGLAFPSDEAALEAVGQYVAIPSLALDCEVTVHTERQRVATSLSGPLRIFSPLDDGGEEDLEVLLGQMEASTEGGREATRHAYEDVLRYDLQTRQQIAQALNEGELARRLVLADAAIARHPGEARGHAERARVLLEAGRYEDAVESVDRALSLGLDSAELHLDRGRALMLLEREDEALRSFDRSLELSPDVPDTHHLRALALVSESGRDAEVLAALAEALRLGFVDHAALEVFEEWLAHDQAVELRRLLSLHARSGE